MPVVFPKGLDRDTWRKARTAALDTPARDSGAKADPTPADIDSAATAPPASGSAKGKSKP